MTIDAPIPATAAEIAAIRRDFELLAADIRKTFEEAGALAKSSLNVRVPPAPLGLASVTIRK